uniref:protein-tyrosine-phosphatase n=1 Tax=Haemonchus placei TaxID=6290 RepID=A0A0N4W960_HAEPC
LKPGEYMFDFEGSTASKQSLASFIHRLCASNVYRMFFAYTQVLQVMILCDKSKFPVLFRPGHYLIVHSRHPTGDHDYIHANWVDGYRERKKFIITQAPLPQTVDQFWKMVWQEKSLIVVSMIQTVDVPAGDYFTVFYHKTTYPLTPIYISLPYISDLQATCEGSERRLLHFCFFAWGHRATPKKPTEILNFISDFNYNRDLLTKEAVAAQVLKQNEKSPIVLHCLAGTSRSATIAALDISFKKLDDTATRPCGAMLDVDDVVQRLRTQRAMAVQVSNNGFEQVLHRQLLPLLWYLLGREESSCGF